ncbi:MAG TPA: glycosyltransferase family A protein [Candidatus Didemnitutus sp.]|nr:glycosyltransferase family A protein [Candidatus Didemnitutus sp.]
MSSPRVSIIVPCHNAAPWLAATLDSALAQTWLEKEVIVIDDGSTDGSRDVARAFVPHGVTLVEQENRGASAARNHGLRLARGDYIQFLDADDLLAPDKIERQLWRVRSLGNRILASGAWTRFHDDPAAAAFVTFPNSRDLSGVEFLQLHYEECCMMHPAAWLAPRPLLDAAGPWNESLSLNDDGEYFARVMLGAERIVYCGEARSYYRSGLPGSLSARKDRASLASLFRSTELVLGHLQTADSSPRTRAATAYAWLWTAFELHPGHPELSRESEARSRALGGTTHPLPGGRAFQWARHVLGWRWAKTLAGR